MKKLAIAVFGLVVLAMLASSCAPKHCAAYGEAHKYQKDRRH